MTIKEQKAMIEAAKLLKQCCDNGHCRDCVMYNQEYESCELNSTPEYWNIPNIKLADCDRYFLLGLKAAGFEYIKRTKPDEHDLCLVVCLPLPDCTQLVLQENPNFLLDRIEEGQTVAIDDLLEGNV